MTNLPDSDLHGMNKELLKRRAEVAERRQAEREPAKREATTFNAVTLLEAEKREPLINEQINAPKRLASVPAKRHPARHTGGSAR